jgi:hypothetical protein
MHRAQCMLQNLRLQSDTLSTLAKQQATCHCGINDHKTHDGHFWTSLSIFSTTIPNLLAKHCTGPPAPLPPTQHNMTGCLQCVASSLIGPQFCIHPLDNATTPAQVSPASGRQPKHNLNSRPMFEKGSPQDLEETY